MSLTARSGAETVIVEMIFLHDVFDIARTSTHLILGRTQEDLMAESAKPRLVGFNHVAIEVGDIDEALAFYGRLFGFELRGKERAPWRSSISATSSSRCRRAGASPPTMGGISALSSTIRRR